MRNQFDSCSYNELTSCAKARIKAIRENQRFLDDFSVNSDYPLIRTQCFFKIHSLKVELSRLLKMRRILKSSGRNNWDTNYFGDVY